MQDPQNSAKDMDYDNPKIIRTIAQTVTRLRANLYKPPNTACLAVENLESSATVKLSQGSECLHLKVAQECLFHTAV